MAPRPRPRANNTQLGHCGGEDALLQGPALELARAVPGLHIPEQLRGVVLNELRRALDRPQRRPAPRPRG
jgi:hypothetical protein